VSAAREEILARIRAAPELVAQSHEVGHVPRETQPDLVAQSHEVGHVQRESLPDLVAQSHKVERFAERVADYRARVEVTGDPASAAAALLAGRRVAIAPDLPAELRPAGAGVELVEDDGLAATELDALDAVLSTCAAACAETGTIALDGGPGQGRRALTLVPDVHVCVVRADQIVATVPELIAALEPAAREGRPIVLVSGPSATSDIELNRVEGVHGPRTLVVLIRT
jgi:L-lactate dehydrogenase complex protein LldG